MARHYILALAAIGATLSGCSTAPEGSASFNRGLEPANQPIVSRTDYVFDVAAPEYGGMSPAEAARLDGWFQAIGLSYGDTVYLDDPQGAGDPARRVAIAAVADRYGLGIAPGAPFTAGNIAPGAVRVIVSRSGAYVPDCPNWERQSQPTFESATTSNFGCASNGNLAAMIANPEDLVRGRVAGRTDGTTAAKAVTGYRTSEQTGKGGLKNETTGGK